MVLCVYFFLHWVFVAVRGLSLLAAGDGSSLVGASHGGGFSCCGAQARGPWASVVAPCRLRGVRFPGSRTWGLQELWCPGSVVVVRWP